MRSAVGVAEEVKGMNMAARRLLPFQNLFYLRWLMTTMQDEVADEMEAKGR
jgi:hypothetical protein